MQIGFDMDNDNIFSELSWSNAFDEQNIEVINNEVMGGEIVQEDKKNSEIVDDSSNSITKCICIEDVMKEDLTTLTSNEILQYECSIAYFTQALFEGDTNSKLKSTKKYDNELTFEKIKSIIEYLQWISNACFFLAKKIKQEIIPFKDSENPTIIRSSYNFCSRYTQCKNFYSKHQEPICTEHHYVHSLLRNDIESVIAYLNFICQNKIIFTKENLDNVHMSIKTICFVTRHMAKEISYIDYITKNNSEMFHRNNPVDVNKKKPITKLIMDGFQKGSQFNDRGSNSALNLVSNPQTNPLSRDNSNFNRSSNQNFARNPRDRTNWHSDQRALTNSNDQTNSRLSPTNNPKKNFNLERRIGHRMDNRSNYSSDNNNNEQKGKPKNNSKNRNGFRTGSTNKKSQNCGNNIFSIFRTDD